MKRNFVLCFFFCFLSALIDICYFHQAYTDQLVLYVQYHSWALGGLRLAVHALILLSVSAAFLVLLGSVPKVGGVLQWGVWFLLNASYHVFYEVMHRLPDAQDVRNLLATPWDMASGTILAVVSPMNLLKGCMPAALVMTVFLLGKYALKTHYGVKPQKTSSPAQRTITAAAALIVILLYLLHPTSRHVFFDSLSNSMHIFMQYYEEAQYYRIPREDYITDVPRINPDDNVVLVIDESIRGDYLSINNPSVDTTPVLERYFRSLPENMWNYGIALSAGTNSLLSQGAIFTGVIELPDKNFSSLRHPTLFQVAKGNHYKTILIDLQGYFPNVVIRRNDMQHIDEIHLKWSDFSNDPKIADINAAKVLHERLKREKGLFVVLIKWGAHVHYEGRYPGEKREHQHYLPKLDVGERHTLDKRREIINSFKNAVRFNVDGFVAALLGDEPLSLPDTTILWVSDHGQSFQEDGQIEPHSTGYLEQALVPFMLFSTEPWVSEHVRRPEAIGGTLSQLNIYPTLMSVFERRQNVRRGDFLSLFWSGEWRSPPLFYISGGSLWNSALSAPLVSNDRVVLRSEKYMY